MSNSSLSDTKAALDAQRVGMLFVEAIAAFAIASQGQSMVPFIRMVSDVIVSQGKARKLNLVFYLPAMRHLVIRAIDIAN